MNNIIKTFQNVAKEYWIDLDKVCRESNPTRESLTLGQLACNSAYYSACNQHDYALSQIELLVKGNPDNSRDINKLSFAELGSMYKSNHLDFYETAIQFRTVRIQELNEQVQMNQIIKDDIELFAKEIGWTLGFSKKSKVKSKKAVAQVVTYSSDQVARVQKELEAKGLLSLR
tara:strand:- start:193 stop:711 length:519 start_codon:yes stop_codon:yes gene_type:complete